MQITQVVSPALTYKLSNNISIGVLPIAPTLISPIDGYTSKYLNVAFSWSLVSNATGYEFQLAADNNFSNVIQDLQTSSTSLVVTIQGTWEPFYWRVRAINSNGYSIWSSIYTITVDPNGVLYPILISPLNGTIFSTGNNTSVDFIWDGNWKGVWTPQAYNTGDLVNYSGSLYLCNTPPVIYSGPLTTNLGDTGPYNGFYYYSNRSWSISSSSIPGWVAISIPYTWYGEGLDVVRSDGYCFQWWANYNPGYGGVGPSVFLLRNLPGGYTYDVTLTGTDNALYWAWWWSNTIQISWPNNYLAPPQDSSWQLIISGSYEYQLAIDNLFNNTLVDSPQTGSTITVDNLNIGTYYWRVRYVTNMGNSPWSIPWYFQIISPPPTPPPIPPKIPVNPIKNLPPDFRPDALIKYIVIHHTETDLSTSLDDVNQQAINDQYFGAPYDIIIDQNGKMAITPQWINASTSNQIIKGASINDILKYTLHQPCQDMEVASLIMTSINIAVIGNFNRVKPLPVQGAVLQQILTALQGKYDISGVYYHRDISATSCPGNNFFSKKFLNIKDLGTDIFNQNLQPVVPIEAGFQIVNSRSNT